MNVQLSGAVAQSTGLHPKKIVNVVTTTWISIALVGQWLFASYIFTLFVIPVVTGNPERVNLAQTITGYVDGDLLGNALFFAHLIPAFVLSTCGILQLLPVIRKRFPSVHRWNGRLFLLMGLMGAISGLYLVWGRGSRLSEDGGLGIILNGLFIPVAIGFAWYYARQARFSLHRRWAIHSFFLVNGVWTFRLYLMAWYIVNQGPRGNTELLDGPTDIALSYACYLLPMAVAELVFWAERRRETWETWLVGCVLTLGCAITAIGVGAATLFMWTPMVNKVLFG